MASFAPAPARASAMARPISRRAPVTSAVRPVRRKRSNGLDGMKAPGDAKRRQLSALRVGIVGPCLGPRSPGEFEGNFREPLRLGLERRVKLGLLLRIDAFDPVIDLVLALIQGPGRRRTELHQQAGCPI